MTERELRYDDLGITIADVYGQMATEDVGSLRMETEAVVREVRPLLRPRFCYFVQRECPPFALGEIIRRQLKNAEAYALFICTAGTEYEQYQRRLQQEGDLVRVFIADALGSVIAEKTADLMERVLQQNIEKLHWHHTNRFSPGYCGWHVSQQQILFPLFNGITCGVGLTESSLMLPIKSVSGIIGLGAGMRRLDYTCGLCDFQQCYKRKKLSAR